MTRFITLISGKGGVGKTTSTLNLAQSLTDFGKKVIILDANFSTPNIALNLGYLELDTTVNHFIQKKNSIREIIYTHEGGFHFIPASSSYHDYKKTNLNKIERVIEQLEGLADFVLVDAPSGLGNDLSNILRNTDEALVVLNPNNSSVMEALKSVELAKSKNNVVFGAILNMSNRWSRNELKKQEVENILGVQILANIFQDKKIKKCLHNKTIVKQSHPRSRTSKEYDKLANYLIMDFNQK